MTSDEGWLREIDPDDQRRFTTAALRLFELHTKLKSVGEMAVMERDLVDGRSLAQARDYFRSLNAHYRAATEINRSLADASAEMAATLERYTE